MTKPVLLFVGMLIIVNLLLAVLYFQDKNISKLIKDINNKTSSVDPSEEPLPNPNDHKQIEVVSDIKGTKAKLIAKVFLSQQLELMKFWSTRGVSVFLPTGAPQGRTTVNNLTIHITDQEQVLGSFFDDNRIAYQSFGTKFNSVTKNLDLYIYAKQVTPDENLESRYSFMILYSLYSLTHQFVEGKQLGDQYSDFKQYEEKLQQLPTKTIVEIKS